MAISFKEKTKSNFENAEIKFWRFIFSAFFIFNEVLGRKKKNKSIDNENIMTKIIIAQKFGNLSIKRC